MNAGIGQPSTVTFTSVRGCEILNTASAAFHAPFKPVTRSTVPVSNALNALVAASHATLIASRFIRTHLRWLIAAMRHGEIELIQFGNEQRRARTAGGWDSLDHAVRKQSSFIEHVDESCAARNVDALSRRIVVNVVGIAVDRHGR